MDAYVSWSLNEDPVFDGDGEEVGSEEYVLIEKLFVPPRQRRQGVARKLLREAISEAKQQYPTLSIKVAALPFGDDQIDMAELVAFYESEGFSVSNCDGHAVIMEM